MHLLAPIAAGMTGAEGGTVEVYARGTSSPITLYTDFEGTTTTSNPASLDANGRAKLYVAEYARCVVKTPGGATVIDFVDGKDANAVELRSASIVGNAYVGGAAAAGNPISVEAAFNKLITSFGGTDFNVLLASASVTLQAALGALWRARVFDVKQYGALGDGATNDLAAINAAASAANTAGGGIVFFPPGTYNISAALTTFSTVEYVGVSAALSIVRTSVDVPAFDAGASAPRGLRNLAFATQAASHTFWLRQLSGAGNCLIQDCTFAACTAATAGSKAFRNNSASEQRYIRCSLAVSSSSDGILGVFGDGALTVCDDCTLSMTNVTGYLASVGANSTMATLRLERCRITYSSDNVAHENLGVLVGARSTTHVRGCVLTPATQESQIFQINSATETYVFEGGNDFSASYAALTPGNVGTYSPYAYLALPTRAVLGSRESAVIAPDSPNGATITVYMSLAERHIIRTTGGAGTRAIASDSLYSFGVNGQRATIAVHNDTGSSITYQWSTGFSNSGTTFAVAANSVRAFSLIYIAERAKWFLVSDTAGAETAE